MVFETNKDVLDWYEGQERVLTPDFISSIPWHQVRDHPLDARLIPVILYMRDVETLTDMYHRELLRTPTGRDPYISKFMERWGVEEITHGEVLNRFLNESGFETDGDWQRQVRSDVSPAYKANMYMVTLLTRLVGKQFTGTHMAFGAVHEMEAAQGYRRLMKIADHPVLTYILNAIIREESAHNKFYWSVARLELRKSQYPQKIARFIVEHFWAPVGQGSIAKERTEYVIKTLFTDQASLAVLDKTVTQRVSQLPGFDGITRMTDTIGGMAGLPPMRAQTTTAAA